MKIYIIIIVFSTFLMATCSKKENPINIAKFEEVLGKTNSQTLTFLVDDFEKNVLTKKYKNIPLKKAYELFLKDTIKDYYSYYSMVPISTKEKFNKSQLKNEIFIFPDSVWIEENWVHSNYVYKSEQGRVELGDTQSSYNQDISRDSVLKSHKNHLYFNSRGKFIKALEAVKGKSDLIKEYYEIKEKIGNISNGIVPYHFERHKIDYSNYFTRRIIVLEFVYI